MLVAKQLAYGMDVFKHSGLCDGCFQAFGLWDILGSGLWAQGVSELYITTFHVTATVHEE
jgi:hypothetical protein